MFKNWIIILALSFLGICANAEQQLAVLTGSATGTYYHFGSDISTLAKTAGIAVDVRESHGSIQNIERMSNGEMDALGIVQTDVLGFMSRSSNPKFQEITSHLRLVHPFYQEEIHIIAGKNIKSFEDLKDKIVITGPKGNGSWLTAMNLFKITGIMPKEIRRMKHEAGLVDVLNKKADAIIMVAGKPVKLVKNLESLQRNPEYKHLLDNIHFVPLNDERMFGEYKPTSITSNDYSFVTTPVPTLSVTAALVSYDFSVDDAPKHEKRCEQIEKLSDLLSKNMSELQVAGHPKWQQVNLDTEIVAWKRDDCAMAANKVHQFEEELLNILETR